MAEGVTDFDVWSRWLLQTRDAGDPEYARYVLRHVEYYRDQVLARAKLQAGMTVVDVGTGEGLIAFGAIAQVGPSLNVVLTDISAPLLAHARQTAARLGVEAQCRFLHGSADRLAELADASVDVVLTRSSLAYVADKVAALREFERVLKPGGRISLAEPILQDDAFETCALNRLIAARPAPPNLDFLTLLFRWKSAQYPATEEQVWKNPLTNYSERDMVRFAREAGFGEIHLELHIDQHVRTAADGGSPASWEVFKSISPHPWSPSLRQVLSERYTHEERQRFEVEMRANYETRTWTSTGLMAYLAAEKPRHALHSA